MFYEEIPLYLQSLDKARYAICWLCGFTTNWMFIVIVNGIKKDPDMYSDVTLGQPRGKPCKMQPWTAID